MKMTFIKLIVVGGLLSFLILGLSVFDRRTVDATGATLGGTTGALLWVELRGATVGSTTVTQ
ncbi:hypothetical protein [Coxiella-like endosymbiont]|uniref:hypothetical protein n=1 Tax=Coxiella-like endosymbiont TaxID=1592897 RepID=UPI00272B7BBB|nr:hypothetical protein [Coxiella-like endosymbiont]